MVTNNVVSCILPTVLYISCILAILAIPSDCSDSHKYRIPLRKSSKHGASSALFVFGDSSFDPGNNNQINTTTSFQANFPPYGETFFHYPTGRFCDGRIVPDFIAEFARLPLIPPFIGANGLNKLGYVGLNFASGGAGALDETFQGLVINLKEQLRFFKDAVKQLRSDVGRKEAKKLVSNAVYLFNIGANDYFFPLSSNSTLFNSHTPEEYASMVVGNFTRVIVEIYKQGGRKFGIVNQGPLGCVPGLRAANLSAGGDGGCLEVATGLAQIHNVLLSETLQYLQQELPGFKYSLFDFFNTSLRVLANPIAYGFKEVKSACCGSGPLNGEFSCGGKRGIAEFDLCNNPSDHLFFDADHPTEAAYYLIAKLMWAGSVDIVGPYNLQALF